MGAHHVRILFSITLFIALAISLLPSAVYAAEPLVHCGTIKDAEGRITNPCSTCDIFVIGQRSLNFIWWFIAAPLAVLMLLWSGFLMIVPIVGGEGGPTYERGKKAFFNTIIGILIIFFAWVAIDSVIKLLAGQIGSGRPATLNQYGPWNTINCTNLEEVLQIPAEARERRLFQFRFGRAPSSDEELRKFSAETGGTAATIAEAAENEWRTRTADGAFCETNNPVSSFVKYDKSLDKGTDYDDWCAAFASWSVEHGGGKWLAQNKTYVPDIVSQWNGQKFSREQVVAGTYTPKPGDLVAYRKFFPEDGKVWSYHMEVVTGYNPKTKQITTVGGNTTGYTANGQYSGGTKGKRCLARKDYIYADKLYAGADYDFLTQ